MSAETVFYLAGALLVLAALALSAVGLRSRSFPSRPILVTVVGAFACLVGVTALYSVLNAQDEQEHREAELAKEEAEAEGEVDQAKEGEPASPEPAAATELALTSPEDGSLSFSPDGLEAPAGNLTLEYDNPSEVSHNVAVELEGEVLGESDTVIGAVATLELTEVAPGEYVYFCTIPGHREGGMEGDLTVSGPEKP